MKRSSPPLKNIWAIVLAGGEGRRMCPLVERWLGHEQPKQYCSFYGSKSLLEYTVERAYRMAGEDRIVTVIGNGHRAFLHRPSQLFGRLLRTVLKGQGAPPWRLTTDKLKSYPAAHREVFPSAEHRTGRYENNRLKSHINIPENKSTKYGASSQSAKRNDSSLSTGKSRICSATVLISSEQ